MSDDDQPLNAEGAWAQQAEARIPERREREEIERGLTFGLEAAQLLVPGRDAMFRSSMSSSLVPTLPICGKVKVMICPA